MLRLTKKADYGLIALKHLAGLRAAEQAQSAGPDTASAKEVADTYGIPLPLLSKILQRLAKAGFLTSEHGTNGGYRLSRDPRTISALEVIRVIDGPIILTECFTEHGTCTHTNKCSVRHPLSRIHEGILRLLNSVTIQDMLLDSEEYEAGQAPSAPLIMLSGLPTSAYRD